MKRLKHGRTQTVEQPTAHQLLETMLNAMRDLDVADTWMLAAAIDWMRQVWCGSPEKLHKVDTVPDAAAWIAKEAVKLRHEAIRSAANEALRAAVTS